MTRNALILEDSKTQAAIIGKMIAAQGWGTLPFEDVKSAMDAFHHVKIDALFLDIFVGDRNTLKHFDRFRYLAGQAPIVLMTAGSKSEALAETLKKARKAGADYVLSKPFTEVIIKDVLAAIGEDPSAKRKHVLIIDDSPIARHFARDALAKLGARISEAGTMEEAFASTNIAHVDLVICDIFMPGMGGLKGMRMIRQTWPKIKIISMSAGIDDKVSSLDALNAARKIGVDAQIGKPFAADDLLTVTEMLLTSGDQTPPDTSHAFILD